MAIYLNVLSGSRDLEGSAVDKAITAMAIRLAHARQVLHEMDNVSIDLTLMLPSKHHKPDFQGMRMTRFSLEEATLYMESVIPEKAIHSENAELYISAVIQDAVENAASFFDEKGLSFCHKEWMNEVVLRSEVFIRHDVNIHQPLLIMGKVVDFPLPKRQSKSTLEAVIDAELENIPQKDREKIRFELIKTIDSYDSFFNEWSISMSNGDIEQLKKQIYDIAHREHESKMRMLADIIRLKIKVLVNDYWSKR